MLQRAYHEAAVIIAGEENDTQNKLLQRRNNIIIKRILKTHRSCIEALFYIFPSFVGRFIYTILRLSKLILLQASL